MKNHLLLSISFVKESNSKLFRFLLGIVVLLLFAAPVVHAQVVVTVTNPANTTPALAASYTSLFDAIGALNMITAISGPVTLTAASGSETAPPLGYAINFTAVTSATNNIVITGSGTTITAGLQAAAGSVALASNDAIFKIVGGDFITIQNFTMVENPGNTVLTPGATNTMTEFGVLIVHKSATDGAQNNIIQNNDISLNSAYTNSIGIFASSAMDGIAPFGALDATSTAGTNSNNKIYGNTISNVAYGVGFICPPITATVFETGNDIGGTSASTANSITFGNVTASSGPWNRSQSTIQAGIFLRNAAGNSVRFNTVTSNTLAYVGSGGLNGILINSGTTPVGVTYTSTVSENSITLTTTGTALMTGIDFGHGIATGTIASNLNGIIINQSATAAVSAAVIGLKANYIAASSTVNFNIVTINQSFTTGATATNSSAVTGITAPGGTTGTPTINVLGNAVTINRSTNVASTFTGTMSGTQTGIQATVAATTVNIGATGGGNNNTVKIKEAAGGGAGTTVYSSAVTFISAATAHATANIVANNMNTIGSTIRSTGTLTVVSCEGTVTALYNVKSNTSVIDRVAASGNVFFTGQTGGPSNVADTVSNNTITFTNLATTGTVTGVSQLGGPSAAGVKSICNNTVNISGTNTGTTKGIAWGYSAGARVSGNNITINCPATTLNGLDGTSTSAGGNGGLNNNTISLTSSAISPTAMNGITGGATGPFLIANNTFSSLTFNGIITTSPTVSGIAVAIGTGNIINNNVINNISVGAATSTGSPTVDGILISGGVSTDVYKNKIYGITTGATGATTLVNGIRISGGGTTANTVYNNLIGNLTSPASGNPDGIRGISITSTTSLTTNNIYFNTINVSASSSGANFGTTGIFHAASGTSTTATLNLRNNIIVNTSTSAGTGVVTCFRRSAAATYGNYGASSNNNDFYSLGGSVMYDGTTAFNLTTFKAAVAPRETASFSEDPEFQSVVGSNANFLKYKISSAKQIESGAVNIGGITDDYVSTVRFGNAGYVTCVPASGAPDIGAWELCGISLDLAAPTISYTPLNSGCTPFANQVLMATITDASGVPTAGAGLPMVYWKVNAGPYTGTQGVFVSGSTYTFAFGNTANTGDVVSYYIVAQDAAGTPNVVANPSAGASGYTSNPPAASVPPTTPNTYSILTILAAGTYSVGSGGTYSTLTAAISDYNAKCLGGNIIFNLTDLAYSGGETFPIVINANPAADAFHTLTIKPNASGTSISGSVASAALIKLNATKYVTIDGSTSGGVDRSLSITNSSTTSATAIHVASLGTGLGATNNVIKNCNISTGSNAATSYGIYAGGITPGTTGADNDNLTIQNNSITTASNGIVIGGTAAVSGGGDDGLVITSNIVGPAVAGAANISLNGIFIVNAIAPTVTSNTVRNVVSTSSTVSGIALNGGVTNATVSLNNISNITTSPSSTTTFGMYIGAGSTGTQVTRNSISSISQSSTGGYPAYGVYVNTTVTSSNVTIANNVIYDIFSYSDPSNVFSFQPVGIFLDGTTGGVNVFFNSVNLFGGHPGLTSATLQTCIFVNSAVTALNLRDNVLVNSYDNTSSSSDKSYTLYSAAPNTAFTSIDNNDYFVSGTPGVLGFIGSDRTNLAGMQAGFGSNTASINGDPLFNANTDLRPNIGSPIVAAGENPNTTGITVDYLNVTRGTPPSIGAYENAADFLGPVITYTPGTIFPNTPFFCNPTVSVTITDASMVNTTAGTKPRLWYKYTTVAGGTHTNANVLPGTNDNTTDGWKYVEYSSNVSNTYTFTLDYSKLFGGLPVTGDKISYFFVAQDLAASPNFSSNVATFTVNPTTVALTSGAFPVTGTNEYVFSSLTTNQPSTASVSAGAANVQVIRVDVPPTSCGNVTQITFNTNGTSNVGDLAKARVYYTTTTTFATTTQFGIDINNPSGSLVFTGTQAASVSTTNYFWLVYDISCTAPSVAGNVADAEFTEITLGGVSTIPVGATNINPTGTRTITSLVAALATNQPSTATVTQGAVSQQVLRVDVPPTNCGNITKIDFGNASTSLSDVTKARVYYTTTTTFTTTTQFGSDVVSPGLAFSVTGSQTPSGSLTNYFWLVYDISCTATSSNIVDASVSSVMIGATGYTPATANPTGTRAITALLAGDNVQTAAVAVLGSGGGNPYDISGRTIQANEPTPIINSQPVATNGSGVSNYSWGTIAGSTFWYRLDVPTTGYGSSGNLLIRATTPVSSPSADAQVALWKFPSMVPGTCSDPANFSGGILLAANDDAIVTGVGYYGPSASSFNSVIRVRLIPGQTYYIQLDGYNTASPNGDVIIEDLADVSGKNVPNNGFGAIHNPTGVDMRYASYEVVGDDGWTYYYNNNGTSTDIADDIVVLGLNWTTSSSYLWKGINAAGNDLMNHVRRDATSTFAPSATGPASGSSSDAFIVWSGRNNATATSNDLKPTAPYVTASTAHWWMMNKFWNAFPNVQPSSSIGVRFFYSDVDFTSLQSVVTGAGGTLAVPADMNFIKATKSVSTHYTNAEMDPASGHAALTAGTVTDLTTIHTAGVQTGINQAQFNIGTFSGGGGGSTGTPFSPLNAGCFNAVGGIASGNASFCDSGTPTITDVNYSTGTGTSYQWMTSTIIGDYPSAGTIVAGQTNPASLTTGTVTQTRYYWLRVTCPSGVMTDYSNNITVTIIPTPNAGTVNGSSSLCAGDMSTYTATGNTGGTWSSTNTSAATVVPGTGEVTAVGDGTTQITYTVAANSCGPLSSSFKLVTVNVIPNAGTVNGPSTLCVGDMITYTKTGQSGGMWSSSDVMIGTVNASSGLVTAVGPGGPIQITYTIAANSCGPMSSNFTLVTVAAHPTATIGTNPTVCSGTTSALLSYTPTTGSPDVYDIVYTGAPGNGFMNVTGAALSGGTINLVIPVAAPAGIYNGVLTVRNTGNACPSVGYNFSITIVDNPAVTLGTDPTICKGVTSAMLTYTPTAGSPDQYSITYTGAPGNGFMDVPFTALAGGVINLVVPGSAPAGTYNGMLIVKNSTTTCTSPPYNFGITISPPVVTSTMDSGPGTLRDIIACVGDGTTITFALSPASIITLTSGEILIDKNITLAAPGGSDSLKISGNGASRIFQVIANKTLTIQNLTLTQGTGNEPDGGAILVDANGNLILDSVLLTGNSEVPMMGPIVSKGLTNKPGSTVTFIGIVEVKP